MQPTRNKLTTHKNKTPNKTKVICWLTIALTVVTMVNELKLTELPEQKRTVLAQFTTDPKTLTVLAADVTDYVRGAVAENPNAPTDVLTVLASDVDTYVRWYVAANLNTSKDTLTVLATDVEKAVREHTANNPNTASDPQTASPSASDDFCKQPEGTVAEAVSIIKDVAQEDGYTLGNVYTVRDADLNATFIAAQVAPTQQPTNKSTAIWANTDGNRTFAAVNETAQSVTKGLKFTKADASNAAASIAANCVTTKP